jgi:hypothetical protein
MPAERYWISDVWDVVEEIDIKDIGYSGFIGITGAGS